MAPESGNIFNKSVLPVADWLAENAYIAPGMHRFTTALGLMSGLMAGRYIMDILVGADRHGEPTEKKSLPEPLQPFHGLFSYNKFSDSPDARWHKIMDNCAPAIVGAMGAMAGSALFFRHLHPAAAKLTKELAAGSEGFYLQQADYMAGMVQSKHYNRLAGLDFTLGSTTGAHLFPNPFSTMNSAIRFQLGAGKKPMMPGLFRLTGNRGAQSMNLYHSLSDMMSWAENNIAHYAGSDWYHDNNALFKKARNALQNFKDISPEQQQEFEQYILKHVGMLESVAAKVSHEHGDIAGQALLDALKKDSEFTGKMRDAFWGKGLENQFVEMGLIDPLHPEKSDVLVGDNGILSGFSKLLGSGEAVEQLREQWLNAFRGRHGVKELPTAASTKPPSLFADPHLLAGTGLGLAGMTTLGVIGSSHAHAAKAGRATTDSPAIDPALPRHEAARIAHSLQPSGSGINGKPLDMLSWISNVLVVPPSMHRFMNAASLSVFLYGGMQLANSLAGRGLRGETLSKDQVWFPLLHGSMDYVWKSGKAADRWKFAAHQLIPVAVGALGTYSGSKLFFRERIENSKKAEFLEDYTDKISIDESDIYAKGAAATSILNTGSGIHLLPLVSYSSNLQNRFLMAQGQQVATPGLGELWSGNPSKYPYHVKRLLDVMITYAVRNPSEFPMEFDDMAHALIGKIYPQLGPADMKAKEDAFIDEIYAVRDKYWQKGGIPQDKQAACRQELKEHFRGAGLEQTLLKIGLNPLDAQLDHNGLSGWAANFFGAHNQIREDIDSYREKAAKRLQNITIPASRIAIPALSEQLSPQSQLNR